MLKQGVVARVVVGLAIVVLSHSPGAAQPAEGESGVEPGARVRVTFNRPNAQESQLTGDLRELGAQSLTLALGSSDLREIPRTSIVRLERRVQQGRKTRGALIGFGVGFPTLFLLSEIGGDETTCFRGGRECGLQITASAVLAVPAAVVGALVAPGDTWAEVPLGPAPVPTSSSSRRLQLRLVPMVGRANGLTLVGSF
jgi:hypothetical protein